MRWRTARVDVDGVGLHVWLAGDEAAPPLVLAHGVADDGPCWTTVAEAFADRWHVVAVDARGHGRSDAPDGPYDPATHADDLAGVITALELHRPALLGHSMGAVTALALAGTRSEVPLSVLLEDPPARAWTRDPRGPEREEEAQQRTAMRSEIAALTRRTQAELMAGQRIVAPAWPEEEVSRWAEAKQRLDPRALRLFDARLEAALDWPTVLRAIRCPVLLVTGDPQAGAIVTPTDAEVLAGLVPSIEVVHVPGAGHSIRHDRPQAYLAAVARFLEAVRPTVT